MHDKVCPCLGLRCMPVYLLNTRIVYIVSQVMTGRGDLPTITLKRMQTHTFIELNLCTWQLQLAIMTTILKTMLH